MSVSDTDALQSWPTLHRHYFPNGADARVRLAALSTITAILIQEVSGPISAATNFIHCCAQRIRNGEDIGEYLLPTIEQAGSEMVKAGEIIRRMRGFIATGKIEGRPESLSKMIAAAGAELMCPDGVEGVVQTAIEPAADRVVVDRVLIEQVLALLLENACEALVGRDDRRIAVSASRRGGIVALRIQDSGPGLSDYQFIHLFEPLFSAVEGGAGLRLPICKTIVEAHGGRLWAERPAGGGATFGLSLQAAD